MTTECRKRAHRPRALLLAVFALMAVAVWVNPTAPWSQGVDNAWRAFIGVGPRSALPKTAFATFFQEFGEIPGAIAMAVVLPLLLVAVGRWRSAVFVLAVQVAGPGLISQVVKNIVNRPRPAADPSAGLYGPLYPVDHGSFPSVHAFSAAVALVTILALVPPSNRVLRRVVLVLGVLLIVGIVWERTLINAHWLSDTVAGTIAGLGTGMVLWWAFWPWLRSDHARRPWFLRARVAATMP